MAEVERAPRIDLARVGAAPERVARLEQAIAAVGLPGAGVGAQIRVREAFLERSKKRIEQFDVERTAEVQRLEESQKRLEELRAMVLVQSITPQFVDTSRREPTPARRISGLITCNKKPPSHRGGAIHGLQHGQMIVARRSSSQ